MRDVLTCQACGQPATFHHCSIIAGKMQTRDLCDQCAVSEGLAEPGFNKPGVSWPKIAEQLARILNTESRRLLRDATRKHNLSPPPWMADLLNTDGYHADFSPASLWEMDRYFDDHLENGQIKAGTPMTRRFERSLPAVGIYLGEVVRRFFGGEWQAEGGKEPEAMAEISLRLVDGRVCYPVAQALRRFQEGQSASIAAWGMALGLPVGPRPNR